MRNRGVPLNAVALSIAYVMFPKDQSVSHDFTTDTSDPTPFRGDNHGTECAGVVAMSKNTLCGIGVAFDSKIGGIIIHKQEIVPNF